LCYKEVAGSASCVPHGYSPCRRAPDITENLFCLFVGLITPETRVPRALHGTRPDVGENVQHPGQFAVDAAGRGDYSREEGTAMVRCKYNPECRMLGSLERIKSEARDESE
jgi:hypothetical protein